HIPADVCKPLIPAKQRTIRSQTSANRLWYPNNRQHARLPSSRFALCLLLSSFLISSSIVLGAAITLQVVLDPMVEYPEQRTGFAHPDLSRGSTGSGRA